MTKSVLTVLSILLFMSLIITAGCSKDKDKVDQLEREAMETAADKATADSAAMLDSMTMEKPVAETPQDELSSRSYESPGSGGFTVQVGAGTNREDANYLADRLINWGYEAFVTEVYIDDVSYFRVRVGNLPTYEEAVSLGKELNDRYSVDYWIDNNI